MNFNKSGFDEEDDLKYSKHNVCVCVYVHVWGDDFNMIAAAMGRRFKMLNP